MNSQLRILNDKGIAFYRDYLDELRSGAQRKPPQELLGRPLVLRKSPSGNILRGQDLPEQTGYWKISE